MTDKMTQKSQEDMSREINKDGVAVRTRGYHIWRVIFCIIGVLGMLMFIYPVLRGCHVNIGTLLGTGVCTSHIVWSIQGKDRQICQKALG